MLKSKAIALILFFPLFCSAQYSVRNLFSITGKRDVPVTCIAQDQTGFLWIGTREGLYRYDGKRSERYLDAEPWALKNISALFVDANDKLWIGTRNGKVFTFDQKKADSIVIRNTEKITSFCESAGHIIIGTYGNGLFSLQDNGISHYTIENGLGDNVVYKMVCEAGRNLWCATDGGITRITENGSMPKFQVISNRQGLPDNIVRDLKLHGNRMIVAMQDSGVCYLDTKTLAVERDMFFSNWTMGAVLSVYEQDNGGLILATERNGMMVLEKGRISVYKYEDYIKESSVNQMFVDREKQVWMACQKGLSHFTNARYSFIGLKEGLQEKKILALSVDHNNALWLGSTEGVSKVMNDDMGALVSKKIVESGKYVLSCSSIDPQGNIWFGTYGNGLIVIRPADSKTFVINSAKGLPSDNISHVSFSGDQVLVSTLGAGLLVGSYLYSNGDYIFDLKKSYTESDGLGSSYVYAALANGKEIFMASDGGGLEVLRKGKIENLCRKHKIRSNTVFSLTRDDEGNIWATSNADGLLKYDGKTLRSFSAKNGLRDEQPQQIICAERYIYAISSHGIDKIDRHSHEVTYYDLNETDFDPNLNAVSVGEDRFYSGTNNGILSYRTNVTASDSIKPRVYLRAFFLNYKPFPLDSLFEFRYNQNSLGIAFDGIWLKNPAKIRFRYRLHGLEDEWQYSDEGKRVDYNNLGPGNYTFIVQVQNDENIWSDPTGYSFIILTPIWKSWWFWITVVVLLTLGIYLFIRFRLKTLQKENLLLERRVKERTQQIEKQSAIIAQKNVELEQLSLVASKTDNVVLILDPDGKLEYINESYQKQSGLTVEELKERYGDSIYGLSNNPDIRSIISEAVQQKKSINYESLNRRAASGAEIWESSTLTPIFDERGSLKKIIIIDTDVTLRKKQEQIIVQKNKDITDSIAYARKIQHAILPSDRLIRTHLPEHFVLYLTKDIVSGDFYWFTHIEDCSIIAAVDCTGHGVPGAFMSLIGYNLLNRIVNEKRVTDPKKILVELNTGVLSILHKNESESKDGMDIAICKINHAKGSLEYAGAMRPLWIVGSNNGKTELKEIRADKIPIGTLQKDRTEPIAYTVHELPLTGEETYYIFTDGYADQFGGPKDKKYSTSRFKELLMRVAEKPVAEQEKIIRQDHLDWKGDNEQVDDILVIGFRAGKPS